MHHTFGLYFGIPVCTSREEREREGEREKREKMQRAYNKQTPPRNLFSYVRGARELRLLLLLPRSLGVDRPLLPLLLLFIPSALSSLLLLLLGALASVYPLLASRFSPPSLLFPRKISGPSTTCMPARESRREDRRIFSFIGAPLLALPFSLLRSFVYIIRLSRARERERTRPCRA